MIIVQFWLDYPILREALSRVPEMRVEWERSDVEDGEEWVLLSARGGDYEAFEAGLAEDPTVTAPSKTVDLGDGRLYQFRLTEEGRRASAYHVIVGEGGVVRQVSGSHEGWEMEVAFSERSSIREFEAFCRRQDAEVEVRRLYEERTDVDAPSYGLTAPQRETLVAAVDAGYFEIPREASLADLSDRLDVSQNAASERVRRATAALVRNTLYTE